MRNKIDAVTKAKAALEAIKGELTIAEIAAKYKAHPNMVVQMSAPTQGFRMP